MKTAILIATLVIATIVPIAGECGMCSRNGLFSTGRNKLSRGESIGNNNVRVQMQWDSNLVLYLSGGRAVWASDTQGSGGVEIVMQGDGNLVMYKEDGKPVWSSQTNNQGYPPYCFDNLYDASIIYDLAIMDSRCTHVWSKKGMTSSRMNATDGNFSSPIFIETMQENATSNATK
ncbi:Aste57867_529 [Aphanomyces stellatus]|uniref:Aste57867_529 protein n=1 Tax=Aphanomyces stellatus TaxID=120398 RepID=A0A485K2U9_9STRA|nr:hypothetical protein As57867_000528 [Aphanomyces stellatus]VFT77754.1 Aste57867_529 [Aphanomyces stellatus]